MIDAVDHVAVAVRDLDRAAHTYRCLLGRSPSWRGSAEKLGTESIAFVLRNTTLELVAQVGPGPRGEAVARHVEEAGEGPFSLALAADDLDAARASLDTCGIETRGPESGWDVSTDGSCDRHWRALELASSAARGVRVSLLERADDDAPPAVAQAEAAEDACVEALDHVVINTTDPEAAIALYRDALGIRLALDRSFEARGVRLQFFRSGGVTIEVASRLGEAAAADVPDRLWGLAWRAPRIEELARRLSDAEVDVSETRPGNKAGTRVCTVKAETHGVPTLLIGPD